MSTISYTLLHSITMEYHVVFYFTFRVMLSGVITYVLLSGLSPFMGDTDDQTFQNVISVDYEFDADAFEDISSEAVAFVKRLLVKEPT